MRAKIARLTALVVSLVVAAQVLAAPVGYDAVIGVGNPAAWWKLDDASTANNATATDSAGGAHGTYYGSTTQVNGAVGQAALFDPAGDSDYVTAPNVPMTNNFSVALWGQSATANWNEYGWLSAERGPNGYIVHPNPSARSWRGFVIDNVGGAGAYTQIGQHTPAAIHDAYHHYVITFDDASNAGRMYFDGQLVATNSSVSAVRDTLSNIAVEIGRDDMGDRRGHGSVDEVQIYHYALDPFVVGQQYQAGAYGKLLADHGATVHYRFDEGLTGSVPATAIDSIAPANDSSYYGNTTLAPGVHGTGAEFDGSTDYVSGDLPINDSFTVELWAKSNTENWNTSGWLASARSANGFIVHPSSGKKLWSGYVLHDADGGHHQIGSYTPDDITDFHHYALTYDHATGLAAMYFDGEQVAQNTLSITRNPAIIPVCIGKDDGYDDRYGNGVIDEFALFPTALSPGQIGEHYNALVYIPEPATLSLLALGALGLALRRRRQR